MLERFLKARGDSPRKSTMQYADLGNAVSSREHKSTATRVLGRAINRLTRVSASFSDWARLFLISAARTKNSFR